MELKTEKIKKIEKVSYSGYLYNLTTESGNLFANNILVKNSGGLGTPPHERIVPGMVHRANGGVLYVDEISLLSPKSQQELLTILQEKKYPITGQSEHSSGAMTRSQPVPCFIPKTKLSTKKGEIEIDALINKTMKKYKDKILKKSNLEILEFKNPELQKEKVLVHDARGNIKEEPVIAMHRRNYSGKVIKIIFDDDSELIATPEHPIKTKDGFIEAKEIKQNQIVMGVEREENILKEEDIIKTYHREHQRVSDLLKIRTPKQISNLLGIPYTTILYWKSLGEKNVCEQR